MVELNSFLPMRYITSFAIALLLATSCSTSHQVAVGAQKPYYSRIAYIYEDKVVIVTKSEFTKDEYSKLLALRDEDKEK